MIIIVLAIVVLAVIALGVAWSRLHSQNAAWKNVAAQSSFPLYQPAKLPPQYSADPARASLSSQAIIFSASDPSGNKLVFSEQPAPPDFDYSTFYRTNLVGEQAVETATGHGEVGLMGQDMAGSLVTDSTWVIIHGNPKVSADQMTRVLRGMTPAR